MSGASGATGPETKSPESWNLRQEATLPPSLPLDAIDRFFLLFEGLEAPVGGMWTLQISGERLEPKRLVEALRGTLTVYPKAGFRLKSWPLPFLGWLRWVPSGTPAEILLRVHSPVEQPIAERFPQEIVQAAFQEPIDIWEGPPVRLHWIPGPGDTALLLLRFHHALGDGHGTAQLLQSLFAFYNGQEIPGISGRRPPLVRGLAWRGVPLLLKMAWLQTRRKFQFRGGPAKLFAQRKPPLGGVGHTVRLVAAEKMTHYRQAAREAGCSFNDLLVAAHGRAGQRWLQEKGLAAAPLKAMVNQSLRDPDVAYPWLENRVSAFPVFLGLEANTREEALQGVHRQIRECFRLGTAEAFALVIQLLQGLPRWLLRLFLLPGVMLPGLSESLDISNLGRWEHLDFGEGRVTAAWMLGRPANGKGLVSFALTAGGQLGLSLSTMLQVFPQGDPERFLQLLEEALDELACWKPFQESAPVGF